MTDVELLNRHRTGHDHEAFANLVRRHVGWIYSVARRQLGDSHQSEDVVQAVFMLLHRKAPRFTADRSLVAWLHKTTWYAAKVARRAQLRRHHHESEAAMMQSRSHDPNPPDNQWHDLAPLLDELIEKLNQRDRQAVLLRFYRNLTFAELATQINTTEEAARKRVDRAIDKLRRWASKDTQNTISCAALCTLLSQESAVAPPGLVASSTTIAQSTITALSATSTPIANGALTMMNFAKLKIAASFVLMFLAVAGGTVVIVHAANPPGGARRGANANVDYPKLAPFTDTRFRHPEIKVNGIWYEVAAIDGLSADQITSFCRQTYGGLWEKRFSEDLVQVLSEMGHPPAATVKLELLKLDTGEGVTLDKVRMTKENRQAVMEPRLKALQP
jgi:RNA polymerase sigma factor (sigma-70 family)